MIDQPSRLRQLYFFIRRIFSRHRNNPPVQPILDSEAERKKGVVENTMRWEDDGGMATQTPAPLPHQAETNTTLPADASEDDPA
jgi:hypothetical protein